MQLSPDLAPLLLEVAPIRPATTVDEAADILMQPQYAQLLSVPVVEDERVVGIVSRFALNQIFMQRYGRELHGRHPVSRVMNQAPLMIEGDGSLESAAQYLTANLAAPMHEDFIVAAQGRYLGVGIVLDLLRAMERRVADNAARLAEAYRDLQASQAQLVQSEKMASLGQMVAGIAHEINTPLGYVRNNVDMLRTVFDGMAALVGDCDAVLTLLGGDAADEASLRAQLLAMERRLADLRADAALDDSHALLDDTLFGVDQIKEIVAGLRSFSRLDQARIADVNLNDCLDQTLVIARNLLRDKVTVIKRYGEIPCVECSPSQINQVFLNMIGNAAQAIDHDEGRITLDTSYDGSCVEVGIQDNGKGIDEQHLGRIFDPFFTTKPVGQGTGLGLSISFRIIEAHGGRIRVNSRPGQGTRFVISLPLRLPAAATASAAA